MTKKLKFYGRYVRVDYLEVGEDEAQEAIERINTAASSPPIDSTNCRVRLRIKRSRATTAGKTKAPKPLIKFVIKISGLGRRVAPWTIS